jgi:predicted RNase H-like HicB family nuclease
MTGELGTSAYLDIPYVLTVQSVEKADGRWLCRLSYDELPGCVAEAPTALEALDLVEELRERCIAGLVERGRPVPAPRPPLPV